MFYLKTSVRKDGAMLSAKERAILEELQLNPYISQKNLADKIGLSRSATANLISQLVNKGYIMGKAYILNDRKSIICIGGANVDHKLVLKEDLQLYTSNPISSLTTIGGVVRNVAENLGRLDQNVTLLSLVGGDMNGRSILNYCKDFISVHEVEIIENATTGSYSAILNNEGDLILGIADMDIANLMDDRWLQRHRQALSSAKLLVIDTNVEPSAIQYLLDFSRDENKDMVIIGVSAPKVNRVPEELAGTFLTIFNKDESQAYFKTKETDAKKLTQMWLDKGVSYAIVTDGKDGVAYGYQKGIYKSPAIVVKEVVDATGAGDAFCSGVIYGLMNDNNFHDSVLLGQLNASATIQSTSSVREVLTRQLLESEKEQHNAKKIS